MSGADGPLLAALRSSQRLGLLGAEPVEQVVERSEAFVDAVAPVHGQVIDLGSGGGVPGLIIAWRRPDLAVTLVDRRRRCADHLVRLVGRLQLGEHVTVQCVDAGQLAAGQADAVVARGFGPPATVLSVASRLVRPGGLLVVSEPPQVVPSRWAAEDLDRSGFTSQPHADHRVFVAQRHWPRST